MLLAATLHRMRHNRPTMDSVHRTIHSCARGEYDVNSTKAWLDIIMECCTNLGSFQTTRRWRVIILVNVVCMTRVLLYANSKPYYAHLIISVPLVCVGVHVLPSGLRSYHSSIYCRQLVVSINVSPNIADHVCYTNNSLIAFVGTNSRNVGWHIKWITDAFIC